MQQTKKDYRQGLTHSEKWYLLFLMRQPFCAQCTIHIRKIWLLLYECISEKNAFNN